MSRSNYVEYIDDFWCWVCWRGAVNQAIGGKRGQRLLRDLATALDSMPEKKLIAEELEIDGEYCALGVLGAKRRINLNDIDPEDSEAVAKTFNIADALAREISYINDEEGSCDETKEERWLRVREWVDEMIIKETDND